MVFAIVVVMLSTTLITALLSLHQLEMKKSIRTASNYQAELAARSTIDAIVSGLNGEDGNKITLPKEGITSTLTVTFDNENIGSVDEAQLVNENNEYVIVVQCTYQGYSVRMRGYLIKNQGYEVNYYEMES